MFTAEQWSRCGLMKAGIAPSGSPREKENSTRPSKPSGGKKGFRGAHALLLKTPELHPCKSLPAGFKEDGTITQDAPRQTSEEPNTRRSVSALLRHNGCQNHTSVFLSSDTETQLVCWKLQIICSSPVEHCKWSWLLARNHPGQANKKKRAQEEPSGAPQLKVDIYKDIYEGVQTWVRPLQADAWMPTDGLVQTAAGLCLNIIKNLQQSSNQFSS